MRIAAALLTGLLLAGAAMPAAAEIAVHRNRDAPPPVPAGGNDAMGQPSLVPQPPGVADAPEVAAPVDPTVQPLDAPVPPPPGEAPAFTLAPGAETAPQPLPQVGKALVSLPFAAASDALPPWSAAVLAPVTQALAARPQARLVVSGYASGEGTQDREGRNRSLQRALAVRAFLAAHGIDETRMDVRALGDKTDAAARDRVDLGLKD